MITPILKDPKSHGGTLYTFPSASRDMTRAFSNSEYEFAFSHFACLNLPDFRFGKFSGGDYKGMYLDSFYHGFDSDATTDDVGIDTSIEAIDDLNKCLKWHLQSYVMNYEVALLNGFSLDAGKYDMDILRTPSERIFFNWLQKVGGIKFDGKSETLSGYKDEIDSNTTYEVLSNESELASADRNKKYRIGNKLYTWKSGAWRSKVLVGKTVQYIGTIDMTNTVNVDFDCFNEIYLNIPVGVGGSTNVVFDNIFDTNYDKGEIIDVDKDNYCEDPIYIIGRNPEELGMNGDITLKAIYDLESDHSYKIDSGYCINFSDGLYSDGNGRNSVESMNLASEDDFEFNCVLVYYKIRKGNGEWYTNLYGVLFLEEISVTEYDIDKVETKDDERVGYIQRYPKFKNGNSWGLKIDLKIDAQPDSQLVLRDNEYVDPNGGGAGMQMFAEALMQLGECSKLFYTVKNENTEIEERLYKLENMVSGVDTVYDLRDEVGILRTKVEMFQPTLDSLVGRIESLEKQMTQLDTNLNYLIKDLKK